MNDSKRLYILGFFFLISITSVFLFSILLFFLYFTLQSSESEGNITSKGHLYQFFHVDPSNDESHTAIVRIPEEIPESGYISVEHKDGSFDLFSAFGMREYECSGKCKCSEDRRSGGTLALNSGLVLVAALTSAIAVELATETLQEKCLEAMRDECTEVDAEVTMCAEAVKKKKTGKGCHAGCKDCVQTDKGIPRRRYNCKGRCKFDDGFRFHLQNHDEVKKDPVKDEICKQHEMEKDMYLRTAPDFTAEYENKLLQRCFAHRYLGPWCRKRESFCTADFIGCRELELKEDFVWEEGKDQD